MAPCFDDSRPIRGRRRGAADRPARRIGIEQVSLLEGNGWRAGQMRTLERVGRLVRLAACGSLLLLPALSRAAVEPESGLGLPRDVSKNGHLVDWLMNITNVFNIILFIIMCVWMGYACLKHNRNHPAEYDHGSARRSVTIAIALSAFIFAVVDGTLFVNAIADLDHEFWNYEKVA